MFNKLLRLMFLVVLASSIFVACFLNSPNVFAQTTVQPVVYVPITITNNQNVATPNPFQQMIVVNSVQYAAYEASDLSNVAFSYPNGTVAPSWLESGNSNSATSTIYWVRVGSIPAGSSTTIFMNFYPKTSNVLNSQNTGEAPDLSPSRGQYDDGANVFIIYADFMNSLSGWQPFTFFGNFLPVASSKGIKMTDGGTMESTYLFSSAGLPPVPIEIEEGWSYDGNGEHSISMFGSSPFGSSTAIIQPYGYGAPVLNYSISANFDQWRTRTTLGDFLTGSTVGTSSFTGGGSFNMTSFLTCNGTYASAGYAIANVDLEHFGSTLVPTVVSGTVSRPFNNNALILGAYSGGIPTTQYVKWAVVRALPPNGVMPSVQMGNVTPTIVPSVSISPSSVGLDVGQLQLFSSSVVNGTSPFSYQWYLNDVAVSGATGSTWAFVSSSAGSYSVYLNVTDGAGFRIKSNVVAVAVNSMPSVSASPGSAMTDVGQMQLFTSTVSNGTSPFSYQWYLDGAAVSGATGSTWAFVPSSSGSHSVYLNATDSTGVTAKSNVIAIAVNPAPSVTVSPVSAGLNVGQLQLFISDVSNGTSPFSYQWCLNGSAVSGATGSTWAFVPSSAGSYSVYLNVTDSVGDRVKSNTATVTVSTVVPEFTPIYMLPLFIAATLMIVIVQKRKHSNNQQKALR